MKDNTFIIGEIGINHNGSVKNAKKLIDEAKKSGFDAVKFQKRDPEICTPLFKQNELRKTPWGKMTYLDYKKKIELNRLQYNLIDKYCKRKKIKWFASVWDIKSLNFIKKYRPKYIKISSAMLQNYNLIDKVSKLKNIHILISTGMASMKKIEKAVSILKKNKNKNFTLLHSVSIYPCDKHKLNLKFISILKNKFKCKVGYSGHESKITPSLLAVAAGAKVVERHITLNKKMWGTDQSASLNPSEMKQLVNGIRDVNNIMGNGEKKYLKEEMSKFKDQKYW